MHLHRSCVYVGISIMEDMKDRIRQVMNWANMTQQEFAQRLHVSPASLSSIFSGRTRPTNMHVSAIHIAFPQIRINWLLFGEGDMLQPESTSVNMPSDLFELSLAGQPTSTHSPSPAPEDVTSTPVRQSADAVPVTPAQVEALSKPTSSARTRRAAQRSTSTQVAATTRSVSPTEDVQTQAKNIDNTQRQVTEIRVFYDNGTYESFFPSRG